MFVVEVVGQGEIIIGTERRSSSSDTGTMAINTSILESCNQEFAVISRNSIGFFTRQGPHPAGSKLEADDI